MMLRPAAGTDGCAATPTRPAAARDTQLPLPSLRSIARTPFAGAGLVGEPLLLDHAAYLRARWQIALRERFYREHQPDVADAQRSVLVAVPVPRGWRIGFGQRAIHAFGCTGSLLTGQVMEGSVLAEFPLALLRVAVERYLTAVPAGGSDGVCQAAWRSDRLTA